MQIQQNSCRHLVQVMWLHPWFFSILETHLGHDLVLARIQFAVSDSLRHFSFHLARSLHPQGECGSSPHKMQKLVKHPSQ
mmetsp:Transcript_93018/g.267611  ORF Transcript_93018/g.267611 Transcript_93018/m.267611 type:complete len:80 (+) Transcript_93018:488-727(+)